jgi:hypothetical protein
VRTLTDIRDWIIAHHADEAPPDGGRWEPETFMPCTWISTLLLCVPLAQRPSLPGWHLLLPEDIERVVPLEPDAIREEVADVVDSAWWEVPDHHGFTPRTCIHECAAWLWLLGEDALAEWCQDPANWPMMGVPVLRRVAEDLSLEDRHTGEWEDRMARGEPCGEGCEDCQKHGGLGYPVAGRGGAQ